MTDSQIGLIMVHGIGEQGRFEHLNTHIRGVVEGLRRGGAAVTVEITSVASAAFQATQDSWGSGAMPSVQLIAQQDGVTTCINVHEVWWANVNERYSLAKQRRFWRWGLSIWRFKPFYSADVSTQAAMFPARYRTFQETYRATRDARKKLFALGCFFMIMNMTIGIGTVLLKRLLNIEPPDIVKVFANYMSSVKLYSQLHRDGTSAKAGGADFLDNIGLPPRFSIRRRMIRTIADVACQDYVRWYIMAHSQGSVVAFNGLMEPAFGWPGYLDEPRWRALIGNGMAGCAKPEAALPEKATRPPRPVWLEARRIVYRRRVFSRFEGILTYGCPLEKFAAIWPATVATCREPAFSQTARWLNVFDPLDPVSGVMVRWPQADQPCCPKPENIGYASSPYLLIGHVHYLDCPLPPLNQPHRVVDPTSADWRLADGVALWLRTGSTNGLIRSARGTEPERQRFFWPGTRRVSQRTISAWVQWILAFIVGILLGAALVPTVLRGIGRAILSLISKLGCHIVDHAPWLERVATYLTNGPLRPLSSRLWLEWVIILPIASAVAVLLIGWLFPSGLQPFNVSDTPLKDEPFTSGPSPEPP